MHPAVKYKERINIPKYEPLIQQLQLNTNQYQSNAFEYRTLSQSNPSNNCKTN